MIRSRPALPSLFLSLVLLSVSLAARANTPDEAALLALRAAFGKAIETKDLAALRALFYDGKIVWRATGHPASRAQSAKLRGQSSVPVVEEEGAHLFLDDPQAKSLALRETFGPARIDTDGQMASMTFNYDFRTNGQVSNWGKENWQLVKVDGQWKILHLLFSYHFPEVRPRPNGHTQP
jgi:hypothetical protein